MRATTIVILATVWAPALHAGSSRIHDTVHNLSASGPGTVKSMEESQVCVFCHAAHTPLENVPQLWNRQGASGGVRPYESKRLDAQDGSTVQPNGATRLCLSCHDGTLALGDMASRGRPVNVQGTSGGRMPPHAKGFLGRDLSGTHPVSITVTPGLVARNNAKDGRLVPVEQMRADPDVRLDAHDRIQCTTCHNPHDDSNYGSSGVHFLRKPDFSELCLTCHDL